MISHVVLMKPRPDLTREERAELLDSFTRAVQLIPSVRNVRVGQRVVFGAGYEGAAPDAADFLVTIDFDSLDDLRAYLEHPEHRALGASFNRSLKAAFVYDFEVGGIERLQSLR